MFCWFTSLLFGPAMPTPEHITKLRLENSRQTFSPTKNSLQNLTYFRNVISNPALTCNLQFKPNLKLLFMIISHVNIIAFQLSLFCKNYRFSKTVLYIINRKIHGWLEIPDLFLVLNMTSHLFAALTCEISCSTLEINLVFPRTHVLFSI
jgi:hypothetical protein